MHKNEVLRKSSYTYFEGYDSNGTARWTDNLTDAGYVYQFPEKYHGYSWFPTVVYNPYLDLYIMAVSATGSDGSEFWEGPFARLFLLYSDHPCGPWIKFHDDEWTFHDDGFHYYQPKFSCKFFENNGQDMYLLFSATGTDGARGPFYKINQLKITLKLK